MFDRLSEGFSAVFRTLSGKASITEANVKDALEGVRAALLDADVHHEVVASFLDGVLKDAQGRGVTRSLKPGQEMIGIVHDRLVEFLGGQTGEEAARLQAAAATGRLADSDLILRVAPGPTVVMMCGLQGSGKTTTCGKLAAYLKKRGRSVMLCAADLQRPAAVEQLRTVAEGVQRDAPGGAQVLFYGEPDKAAAYGGAVGVAVGVCQRALAEARKRGVDTLILDTAGRLHIDAALMDELGQVNRALNPQQVFLVVDAMTGQDAVNSARAFHQKLEVDGIILTKFDSDTRGGAALSVKHVTGAPVKFIGVGEKIEALEEFHAERIAGRILGMGDVVSLVEKARGQVDEAEAERLEAKMAKGEMTMDDFLGQLRTLRRMGPLKQLLGLLPGIGSALKGVHIDDGHLDRIEAIVQSMTGEERRRPSIMNNSRRRRVANGSGATQDEVGGLARQFQTVSTLAKQMSGMNAAAKVKAVKELGAGGGGGGGAGGMASMIPGLTGLPGFRAKGSTHSASPKDKFKKRKR